MLYSILFLASLSQGIMEAQSVEELDQFKLKSFQQKKHQVLCKNQLNSQKIPKNCYQIDSIKNNSETLSYIDEKCQEIRFVKLTYSEIKEGLTFPQVSYKCRKILQEKEKILKHIAFDKEPDQEIKNFFKE